MAAGGEPQATQAFPNPPTALYRLYTDENIQSGLAPKPPRPVQGAYQMFGAPFNTTDSMIRPLEEQNIDRVYPHHYDKRAELKKLNRSILICFLELLDILINDPSSSERNDKIKNLSVLFINMHHLINEYRPHQARETLRVVLERQKKQREDMIQQINRAMDRARCILKSCENSLQQAVSSLPTVEDVTETMDVTKNKESVKTKKEVHSLIDQQDNELCNLVDNLLSDNITSSKH